MKNFSGTGVALITPFTKDLTIDWAALTTLVNDLCTNGINYLVVLGTTGEGITLTASEKKQVFEHVLTTNAGRLPLVYGLGGNNTQSCIEELQQPLLQAYDAILSVSPYYNKPTQEGIYQHYATIAKASTKPIILYNVPGRTGSNMQPSTILRLANDFANIIAVKEACGNIEQIMQVIKGNTRSDFSVISGDDTITLPLIAAGAIGVISVVGNVFPKLFSTMVELSLQQRFAEARVLHYQLLDAIDLLFVEGNPAGAKAFLYAMGKVENTLRLPLTPVSESTQHKIAQTLQKIITTAVI